MNELATIFDAIPHDQLAVQWDTNFEFAMLDGVMATWFTDPAPSIVERLVRLGRSIPAGVQLGYHFCHGHERHHRDRPYDAQPLVEIANALSLSLGRSLDWVHLPVRRAGSTCASSRRSAQLAAAARDAALPRAAPPVRRHRRRRGPHRRRPALRARLRRRHRLRLGPSPRPGGRLRSIELHRAVTAPTATVASRLGAASQWPAGWARRPRRRLDPRARRRLRHRLRQRRSPRLVPQPTSRWCRSGR